MELNDTKVIVPRIATYGPKPRNAHQALKQARAFLAEEGQWVAGAWFKDGDPKEAYEKAECGSWQACSMGAIGLVTGEMPVSVCKTVSGFNEDIMEDDWREAVYSGDTKQSYSEWADENRDDYVDEEYEFVVQDGVNVDDAEFYATSTPISYSAAQFLAAAIDPENDYRDTYSDAVDTVINFNDSGRGLTGRSAVLEAFDNAIAVARKGKLPAPEYNEDY